mgnify:FL=1
MAVAKHTADGYSAGQKSTQRRGAEDTVTHADLRQTGARHAVQCAQFVIPTQGTDIEQLGAAGVGVVGF